MAQRFWGPLESHLAELGSTESTLFHVRVKDGARDLTWVISGTLTLRLSPSLPPLPHPRPPHSLLCPKLFLCFMVEWPNHRGQAESNPGQPTKYQDQSFYEPHHSFIKANLVLPHGEKTAIKASGLVTTGLSVFAGSSVSCLQIN